MSKLTEKILADLSKRGAYLEHKKYILESFHVVSPFGGYRIRMRKTAREVLDSGELNRVLQDAPISVIPSTKYRKVAP